jgi:hypothetical protein
MVLPAFELRLCNLRYGSTLNTCAQTSDRFPIDSSADRRSPFAIDDELSVNDFIFSSDTSTMITENNRLDSPQIQTELNNSEPFGLIAKLLPAARIELL